MPREATTEAEPLEESPLSPGGFIFLVLGHYTIACAYLWTASREEAKVVFKSIDNEYILFPLMSTSEEAESIFNLNETLRRHMIKGRRQQDYCEIMSGIMPP
jgi:hypothetical protein